ncbi:hypothetical protein YT14_004648 [Salmonella enterica subsp. enterica serovar Oslo]|nr:hypothetical protein [Salmonella enterica subsp. enterica serovar Oslo]
MNEPVLLFCRQWTITVALAAILAPVYTVQVIPVYSEEQFIRKLREYRNTPVILGISPHEHVAELYWLQPFLAGRTVMFIARSFYWTDYNLPEWLRLERYGFCSWDSMQNPFSRRMELRHLRQLAADMQEVDGSTEKVQKPVPAVSAMTEKQILEKANRWLYRELSVTGLTGYEIRVLSLMTEGQKGNLPPRTRSLHKNNGLYKLGMTKHLMNLYRGVKVRPELQTRLPSMAEDIVTENVRWFRTDL